MPQRVLNTVLVTANVFQNVLARHDPRCQYYTDLLRRLAKRLIECYMTEFDWNLALTFWNLLGVEVDEACHAAYMGMLNRVQPCPFDGSILELSGEFQMNNFCDALRLATAIDFAVDAIVTQEPYQFARSVEESYQLQMDGYFYTTVAADCAEEVDDEANAEHQIGIFSVGAFLLHYNSLGIRKWRRSRRSPLFQIEQFQVISHEQNTAIISLRGPRKEQLESTAIGNTPFDAIQKAIDQSVNQCCTLPPRHLTRFSITPATLTGADSPVEMVVGVECGDLHIEKSACSGNCMRAAAEAYVKVINSIYEHSQSFIPDPICEKPSDPI